jgi:fructokinase
MIVACGEALVDFVPVASSAGPTAYLPRPGGSPFNVASTVGRLGVAAGFLGAVSSDFFGTQLIDALRHSGVDTRYVSRLERSSALAFVNLASVEPQYTFYDCGSAYRAWTAGQTLGTDVTALHFGSISLIAQPAADEFHALLEREAGRRIVSLDPNIRPSVVGANEAAYRARLRSMLARADLVKVSMADLAWLEPQREPAGVAQAWLAAGTSLVVVTAGAGGSTAYARGGDVVSAAAPPIAVVDTVGAGDSFMGALLAGLELCGVSTPTALAGIDAGTIGAVLRFASAVSAITCSRAGADPPWRDQVTLPAPVGRKEIR